MKLQVIVLVFCTLCSSLCFAEFNKEEWKNSGGLCATISVKDNGEEVEYTSRTERENVEDVDYNLVTISNFEDCIFSTTQMIMMLESMRPFISRPDSSPFTGGYLIYNDGGNLKTCTVTPRKSKLDKLSTSLLIQIIAYLGKPIPKELRDKANSEEIKNIIKQNLVVNCSGAFS